MKAITSGKISARYETYENIATVYGVENSQIYSQRDLNESDS